MREGGDGICEADLLPDNFDRKQSRESVDLPLSFHPSPCLITFAFMSCKVSRLLLDLYTYGDTDTLVMFPVSLKRTAEILAPVSVRCFSVFFAWVIFLFAGERLISPQFRKVHLLLLSIIYKFP